MTTKTWQNIGGIPADYNTPPEWGGSLPASGDTAVIGQGLVEITSGDSLPANLTFDVGATQGSVWVVPTSVLEVIDANLSAGVVIDNQSPGGTLVLGGNAPVIGSLLLATGSVTSHAAINVGAGDFEDIAMKQDALSVPGYFDNLGTIDVTGTSANYAGLTFLPATTGGSGASASYGVVNLTYGFMTALAPDSSGGPAGAITLKDGSAAILAADLQNTNVDFADATDGLDIGQNASGALNGTGTAAEYAFGGTISGFQIGDRIGLMEDGTGATPASLSYNSATGELTIKDASNNVLGELNIPGVNPNDPFILTQALSGADYQGYTSQYEITLANVWASGVTGDIDNKANWTNGAMPNSGATAVLQAGTIDIGSSDFVPTPLTLDVGTSVAKVQATSQSNIDVTQTFLPNELTIDNTASGGSIVSPTVNGPVIESALNTIGSVTSDATLNVGAGDVELIGVSAVSPTSGPAWFNNEGAINLDGAAGNYAVALVNSSGANSSANSVFYGAIDLSYGFLFAGVSDTPINGVKTGPTTISLSNSSDLVAAAALSSANVRFVDAPTGDRLDLAPQSSGSAYQFGGSIYNFQPADVIALQETAIPTTPITVAYNPGTLPDTGTLTISENGSTIGTLNVVGNYGANSFSGTQQSSSTLSTFGYAGEYDITVSPLPYTWTGGTADYYTSGAWTGTPTYPPNGASPANPTVATIIDGTVEIAAAATDTAPSNITFDVGALTLGVSPDSIPASVLAVTDNTLGSSVTIDNTAAGGDFPASGSPNLFLSALDTYGQVTFAGTINVGAGDGEFITITPDSPTTITPGYFDNSGVINVTGQPGDQAVLLVTQGGPNANYAAGGYADYGSVNLSNGLFYAEAPDSGAKATSGGVFNLANSSQLVVFNTIFNQTTVHFADATGELILGQDALNQYEFGGGTGGEITGLQAGDTIALEENGSAALPASLSYSAGVLSVLNAGDSVIGAIHVYDPSNLFTTASFIGIQTSNASVNNFTGEYVIRVANGVSALDVPKGTIYSLGQASISGWQPGFLNVVTTATVEGALDVDSAPTATGGSLLNIGGVLTVNSTGVLTIGSGAAMNTQTSVIAGSLANTGQIILSGNSGNFNGLASLTVDSAAGMGGQAGVLTGGVSLSGAAELDFASGGLTTIASGGDLTLSGQQASVDIGSNQGGDSALNGLAAIDSGGVLDLENTAYLSINGALDNSGAVDLATSGSGSSASLQISGTLTNRGALTLGTTSDFLSVASLSNTTSGVIDLAGNVQSNGADSNSGLIEGQGYLSEGNNNGNLTNNSGGTIDANVSGQSLTLSSPLSLVNNGVLEANGGTLALQTGVTGTGSAEVANYGALDFNAGFNQGVAFQDNTGQLLLGQNGGGGFSDSGTITGFQAGDVIGLLSHGAVPKSLGYNATTNILSIYAGANQTGSVLGTLNIVGNFTTANFALTQNPTAEVSGYTAQYNISIKPTPSVSVTLTGSAGAPAAASFNQFLGFGDSNIDSGYFLNTPISNNSTKETLYQQAVAAGGGLPTSIGGVMNSTLLAQDFGLTATPYNPNTKLGTNYAASGATITGNLSGSLAPSITSQIQTYLTSTGGVANSDALYLLSGGGNSEKIAATLTTPQAQAYMVSQADAFAASISTLYADGARYIVIDNQSGSGSLGNLFNATLDSALAADGVSFINGDLKTQLATIEANPSGYGFTNVTAPPAVSASNPYNPNDGGAALNPNPGTGSGQISNSWALFATALTSPNAGTTDLWADDEHLAAQGQLLEANYYQNLIEHAAPTPGETLTANASVVNGSGLFTYQWQILPSGQSIWSNISGQTATSLVVSSADSGSQLRVETTFTDGLGHVVNAYSAPTLATALCFMAGTMIRTPDGEVPVETLLRGDLVLTAEGLARPVCWLGRQTVSTRFADSLRVWPIRIKAGALAENVPCRDLVLSPDHAVLVDAVLIHAGALVNGASILRETAVPEIFTYYHVELDDHSLVLAENTPAETFVDNVERLAFDNWAEHEALYPEGKPIAELPYPRAKGRRQVPVCVRGLLAGRAEIIGALAPAACA